MKVVIKEEKGKVDEKKGGKYAKKEEKEYL